MSIDARIDELEKETAVAGWDGDDAEPIPSSVWASVRQTLKVFDPKRRLGEPRVASSTDGSAHINWFHNGFATSIEISVNGAVYSSTDKSQVLGFVDGEP